MLTKKLVIVLSLLVVVAISSIIAKNVIEDRTFYREQFIEQKMFIPAYIDKTGSFVRAHYETHIIYLGTKKQVRAWDKQAKKFPAPIVKKKWVPAHRDESDDLVLGRYAYIIEDKEGEGK